MTELKYKGKQNENPKANRKEEPIVLHDSKNGQVMSLLSVRQSFITALKNDRCMHIQEFKRAINIDIPYPFTLIELCPRL